MLPFESQDYTALSLRDLLLVRDAHHDRLMRKRNVVGTAIGFYRIRKADVWPSKSNANPNNSKNKSIPRTLSNSEVRPYSWPALLVFVDTWEQERDLAGQNMVNLIDKSLDLPDGSGDVPVCVILAEKQKRASEYIDFSKLNFPRNVISGGFPLIIDVQNQKHVASFGCLLTDGHLVYALTNKHVTGRVGTPVSTILCDQEVVIGTSSELQLGRILFEEVYPTLKGQSMYLNIDVGLIEVNDVNQWKTEVLNIGVLDNLVDLDTNNITLKLINQKVVGFGAVSQHIFEGEIQALFYRYKSVGGFEYVSDFLIGPRTYKVADTQQKALTAHHGDSGSLILLEIDKENNIDKSVTETKYYPLAVLWGMHEFTDASSGGERQSQPYLLASCLSTICSLLDVELVRDWNLDLTNTWGKTGHFKVGAQACKLVSESKLSKLLLANQENIGYDDDTMLSGDVVGGKYTKDFVPLADVADIIWRTIRKESDESNHFCDIDEKSVDVFENKSLIELSLKSDDNIDLDVWYKFDCDMDKVNPVYKKNPKTGEEELRPRRGALPFRVWQMYNQMIKSLEDNDLVGFIAAGGTMSHYVGDACQPLHISYLHHGNPGQNQEGVHSDYETTMLDKKMELLFTGVKKYVKPVKAAEVIGKNGKDAAKKVLQLMKYTIDLLPPEEIVNCWAASAGRGKYDNMWEQLGDRTCKNIAEGSHILAVLWQSAWQHGNGSKQFKVSDMKEISKKLLRNKYVDNDFVPSYILGDERYKKVCY